MKKVCVIARRAIIAGATGERFGDRELEILGGIAYGPVHEVEELTDRVRVELIRELKRLHPGFENAEFELREG